MNGLISQAYQWCVGVPMIGIHHAKSAGKDGPEKFYPPEMAVPLTALLKPNSRRGDRPAAPNEPGDGSLLLVDPISVSRVGAEPAVMPVEADLTTPLAYMWSRTDLDRYRWKGLFRPGSAMQRANLMLLRPYEPGKIPVVMVHGLVSSPLAWIPMINDLLRDPVIHQKYQFMLYMYPTGVPIPIAAAGLRDTLVQAQQMYDPGGTDPAFQNTVLLGHSMGGLISHSMALKSEDKLWKLHSDKRFSDINGKPEVLQDLRRTLLFRTGPLPFVRRVVFLATPHRGSDLSRNVIGRVSTSLIADSDHVVNLLSSLVKDNPDAFDAKNFRRLPDQRARDPEHRLRTTSLSAPRDEAVGRGEVPSSSIIGSLQPRAAGAHSTDGVVPYRSSHLDGVEELVVRSDHGVQKAPLAIQEVRRILLEHVGVRAPLSARRPAPRQAAALAGTDRR